MLLDAWHGQMAICSPKETKIFWKEGTKKREIKSFVEVKQDFILLRITAEEEALRVKFAINSVLMKIVFELIVYCFKVKLKKKTSFCVVHHELFIVFGSALLLSFSRHQCSVGTIDIVVVD